MATDLQSSRNAVPPSGVPNDGELPLFRFGLRQLLIFVSLISLLMAAMATSQGLTAVVLLLATLVIAFHLFSTALGSQLRVHANRTVRSEPMPSAVRDKFVAEPIPQSRSPWHERRSTPMPWLARLIVVASLFGGFLGVVLLSGAIGERSSPAGIIVGAISLAVIAGWIAFVGYSFYGVFRHGLRDAMADDGTDRTK